MLKVFYIEKNVIVKWNIFFGAIYTKEHHCPTEAFKMPTSNLLLFVLARYKKKNSLKMGHFSLLYYTDFPRVSKRQSPFPYCPQVGINFASVCTAPMWCSFKQNLSHISVREQRCDKIKKNEASSYLSNPYTWDYFQRVCLLLSQGKFFFPWTTRFW